MGEPDTRPPQKTFYVHVEGHITVLLHRDGTYEANISLGDQVWRGHGNTSQEAVVNAMSR